MTRRKPAARNDEANLISVATAALRYDVSELTVRRWISEGRISGYRLGQRLIRVDPREINAMVRKIPNARTMRDGGVG